MCSGDLDSVNGAIVMDLLCQLHRRGLTLVMVTHDVHLKKYHLVVCYFNKNVIDLILCSFADRVIWMRDGKIQRIEKNSDEAKKVCS
jgi:ABC-type lipoprotein export system ATPase subunit